MAFCIISGVFIARGKEDALVTLSMAPGDSVYGEKKITVEVNFHEHMNLMLLFDYADLFY